MSNTDDEEYTDLSEDETEVPNQEMEKDYDIMEQALKIKRELLRYTQENSLELCEYLSDNDILEFVNWTLRNYY